MLIPKEILKYILDRGLCYKIEINSALLMSILIAHPEDVLETFPDPIALEDWECPEDSIIGKIKKRWAEHAENK